MSRKNALRPREPGIRPHLSSGCDRAARRCCRLSIDLRTNRTARPGNASSAGSPESGRGRRGSFRSVVLCAFAHTFARVRTAPYTDSCPACPAPSSEVLCCGLGARRRFRGATGPGRHASSRADDGRPCGRQGAAATTARARATGIQEGLGDARARAAGRSGTERREEVARGDAARVISCRYARMRCWA